MTAPSQTARSGIALRYTLPSGHGIGWTGAARPLMLAIDRSSFAWMTSYDRWWRGGKQSGSAASRRD